MSPAVTKKKCGRSEPLRESYDPSLTIQGVLGATGAVGQRFILLLADHPFLVLHKVGASSRSAGKKYKDAVIWKQSVPMSKELGELVIQACKATEFSDCDLVFSGLDSDVAGDIGIFPIRFLVSFYFPCKSTERKDLIH